MNFYDNRSISCGNAMPNETKKEKQTRLEGELEMLNKALDKHKKHKKSLAEMTHDYSYSDLTRTIGDCQVKIENTKENIKTINKQLKAL